MDPKKHERKTAEVEAEHQKEMAFCFEQVNDYPLSDKNLVVNPQTIPLDTDELSEIAITDI